MTERLHAMLRVKIVHALLKHRFDPEVEKLELRELELAVAVYNDQLLELKRMQRLPDGWLPKIEQIHVQFGEKWVYLHFKVPMIVPTSKEFSPFAVYEAGHKRSTEYFKLLEAKQDLEARKTQARRAASVIIGEAKTVKQLLEAWPEVAPFIPEAEAASTLPALNMKTVNQMLALPITEK